MHYTVQYTLYTIHYTLYTLIHIYTIHYTQYTLIHIYTIHYTLYTITLIHIYTIHYTLYTYTLDALQDHLCNLVNPLLMSQIPIKPKFLILKYLLNPPIDALDALQDHSTEQGVNQSTHTLLPHQLHQSTASVSTAPTTDRRPGMYCVLYTIHYTLYTILLYFILLYYYTIILLCYILYTI
jgi:hypothetical protein